MQETTDQKNSEYGHFHEPSLNCFDITYSSTEGIGLLIQLCRFLDKMRSY